MDAVEEAILNLQLTEMQCQVTDECLQLFGGYGYYAGTSEIMKEVIARSMLGK